MRFIQKSRLLFIPILLFTILRIWQFWKPTKPVFDEVYFPVMANQYIIGEKFFDIHPPLGKLIIALSELIFGNNAFAWRLPSVVFGFGLIFITFWTIRAMTKKFLPAWLAACFVAIDGLFIVYSRLGLIDIFMLVFGILSIGFAWNFYKKGLRRDFWLGLIFLGLTISVKWIGFGFIPLVVLPIWLYFVKDKKYLKGLGAITIYLTVPILLYCVSFLANFQSDFLANLIQWHRQAWNYNVGLTETHPYQSKPWTWPLMLRPIWFYYQESGGSVSGIIAFANPLLIFTSAAAIISSIVFLITGQISRELKKVFLYLLFGWLIFYLPWFLIDRAIFFYHYLISYWFALCVMAILIYDMWSKNEFRRGIIIWLIVVLIVSMIYLPLWLGVQIPKSFYDQLIFLKIWI